MKTVIKCCIWLVVAYFATTNIARSQQPKSPLKVLFVGYDPSQPMPVFKNRYPGEMTDVGFAAQYPVRMPAFKALLDQYFTVVATIDCRDWKPKDSDPYDVTIFDFKPAALEPSRQEKKANGEVDYIAARYLPDNFSKPVIFIASTAGEMGERIGLKLDWLCLCLDADAHHLNTHHAIFNGPLEKVTPTLEMKQTPAGIYEYTTGNTVPKQIPMWRVQKTGYLDSKDCRVGLVSRGNRFTDSPDAEVISSGVCQKDVGAVALGRHGNFFLWGFSASPADMTDVAKKVFVNTVAYMKQFDGKIPIARKYNERMATTNDVKEIIACATKEKYMAEVKMLNDFNDARKKQKKVVTEKLAAGQELTFEEKQMQPYLDALEPIPSWEDYLKQTMGPLAGQFGTDVAAYQQYMKENFDYLYCDPQGFFTYSVDNDAKKIGVPNHNIQFLATCISMLQHNDQPDLALKMLKKYTAQDFTTPGEWHSWFEQNKKKIFFTETGGYKFLVNTYN